MSKRIITSLISTVIFFIVLIVFYLYVPFTAINRAPSQALIMGAVASVVYFFVIYYLIGVLEKRDAKKDKK